jgi:hypothetical protein
VTESGLQVKAFLIDQVYEKGRTVSTAAMHDLNIQFAAVCPRWNYTIRPRPACT